MVRLGMVGNVLIHNYPYGAYFNGTDDAKLQERCSKAWMLTFVKGRHPEPVARNSRITHVWAGVRDEAERIADSCRIPNVCATLDEVIDNVDGLLILDEDTEFRPVTVERCLRAGKPVYVDKVLALSVARTRELVALAQENAVPIAAWSQILCAAEAAPLRELSGGAGLVTFNLARDNLSGYGIHLVCAAFAAFGTDPVHMSRIDTGPDGEPMLELTYVDGKTVVLRAGRDVPARGSVTHLGKGTGCRCVELADMGAMFDRSAEALAAMFEQGTPPVEPEAIVRMTEAVALLSAG